jgi:fluoride exporter
MIWLLVAVGGAIGAVSRWVMISILPDFRSGFPVSISAVNVIGSFALGFVIGAARPASLPVGLQPFTVGALGGFTTFSTWMVDIDAAKDRRLGMAIVAIPTVLGVGAGAIGIVVGVRIG